MESTLQSQLEDPKDLERKNTFHRASAQNMKSVIIMSKHYARATAYA